jgi:hypothetical protein
MYIWGPCTIPEGTPLSCLLKHWRDLASQSINKKPQYSIVLRPGLGIHWEMAALKTIQFYN